MNGKTPNANPKPAPKQPVTEADPDSNYEREAKLAWLRQIDDCNSVQFWIGIMTTRLRENDVPTELRAELTLMLARMTTAANLRR